MQYRADAGRGQRAFDLATTLVHPDENPGVHLGPLTAPIYQAAALALVFRNGCDHDRAAEPAPGR